MTDNDHAARFIAATVNDPAVAGDFRAMIAGRSPSEAEADIVAFDPATVGERGTFENPKQYCQGVEHVLVNGVPVIDRGEHTGARPGMVVYGPGYNGGRDGG